MNTTIANPYIGPRTFTENERDRFFGRERESRELLTLTGSEQLVVFYAQSGAGKSSLVNTCLIPDLKKKNFKVFPVARVGGDAPAGLSVENIFTFNLIRILVPSDTAPESFAGLTLTEFFTTQKSDSSPASASGESDSAFDRQILIVDQFEEIFSTHHAQWKKRREFFEQLAQAMEDHPNLWILLVMREDYIASLDPYAHLLPDHARIRYYMQRLGLESAVKAIKGPVAKLRPFEKDVAETLAQNLARIKVLGADEYQEGQYVEPVQLQVVCFNLWENLAPADSITADDIQSVSDINASLGGFYAGVAKSVSEQMQYSERKIREWVEEKLIAPGGIRNMVLQGAGETSGGLENRIIDKLTGLVRAEPRGASIFYELTHDRLVEPILLNNKEWFKKNLSLLQRQAALWLNQGKNDNWLLTGQALLDVEAWAKYHPDDLTGVDREFLSESRQHQSQLDERFETQRRELLMNRKLAEEQSRSTKRARLLSAMALIAMVVALIFYVRADNNRKLADNDRKLAEVAAAKAEAAEKIAQDLANNSRANELAFDALNPSTRFDVSILLSIAAYFKSPDNIQAQNALYQNYQRAGDRLQKIVIDTENPARDFVLSSDGTKLALYTDNGIVIKYLDGSRADEILPVGLSPQMFFSADGGYLGTIDIIGIQIWDVTNPVAGNYVNEHAGSVQELVVNEAENLLVSRGENNEVFVWDLKTGARRFDASIIGEKVVVSPDGNIIATITTITGENTITLWNAQTGETIGKAITGNSVTFSPDGSLLAVIKDNGSVSIVIPATGESQMDIFPDFGTSFSGDELIVRSVLFSPNATHLVLSSDENIILWDLNQDEQVGQGPFYGFVDSFSPDGGLLVVYDTFEGATKLISVTDAETISFQNSDGDQRNAIYGVLTDFSQDGKSLAIFEYYDSTISIWSFSSSGKLVQTELEPIFGFDAEFSPDGTILAVLDFEGLISLFDVDTREVLGDLRPSSSDTIGEILFSPDGKTLAYLNDKTLNLWNIADPSDPSKISLPSAIKAKSVSSIRFTDSGGMLVGGTDGRIRNWDDLSSNAVNEITGDEVFHHGKVTELRFSPDNSRILSIAEDGVVITDIANPASPEKLAGPINGTFLGVNWTNDLIAVRTASGIDLINARDGNKLRSFSKATSFAFSHDEKTVAIRNGKKVELYEVAVVNGKPTLTQIGGAIALNLDYEPESISLVFSPNDEYLAVAIQWEQVAVYSTSSAKQLGNKTTWLYDGTYLQFSPNNKYLYYTDFGNQYLNVKDLTKPTAIDKFASLYEYGNFDLGSSAITMDGDTWIARFAGAQETDFNSIKLFDLVEFHKSGSFAGGELLQMNLGSSNDVIKFQLAGTQNAPVLAVMDDDGNIVLWNVANDFKPQVQGITILEADNPILSLALSLDRLKQALFSDHAIFVRDSNGASLAGPFNDHVVGIYNAYFGQGGNTLVAFDGTDRLFLYDVADAQRIGEPLQIDPNNGTILGDYYAMSTYMDDGSFSVWNLVDQDIKLDFTSYNEFMGSSADGKIIAVKDDTDESLAVWSVETGKQIGAPIQGEEFVLLSPNGRLLVTSSEDQSTFWQIADGTLTSRQVVDVVFTAENIFLSADGRYFVQAEVETESFTVWDTESFTQLTPEPLVGTFVEFSPDGKYIGYTSIDVPIVLLSTSDLTATTPSLPSDSDLVNAGFSPDGRIFWMKIYDPIQSTESITLFELDSGRKILEKFPGDVLTFGVDGSPIVLVNYELNGLLLLDPATGKISKEVIPEGYVGIDPDGRILVTNYDGFTLNFWDTGTGENLATGIPLQEDEDIYTFSEDRSTLILSDQIGNFRLVNWSDPEDQSVDLQGDVLLFTSDFLTAFTLDTDDNILTIWNLNDRTEEKQISQVYDGTISYMAWNEDSRTLAVYGSNGIALWDVASGKPIGSQLKEKGGDVTALMFSPDATYLASVGSDGIIVTEVASAETVAFIPADGRNFIGMQFRDSQTLIYLFDDGQLLERRLEAGEVTSAGEALGSKIPGAKFICAQAFDAQGLQFAYQISKTIYIWNQNSEPSTIETDNRCGGALAFNPDGSVLAFSDGSRIHLWDLEKNVEKQVVNAVVNQQDAFSNATSMFFIGENTLAIADTQISLWDLESYSIIGALINGDMSGLTSYPSWLVYRDAGENIRLLDMSPENAIQRFESWINFLCGVVGRNLSQSEWDQYFPGEAYTPFCSQYGNGEGVILTPIPSPTP